MSDQEYVSIFLNRETKTKLKERAAKLGYPSMKSLIEELMDLPLKDFPVKATNIKN